MSDTGHSHLPNGRQAWACDAGWLVPCGAAEATPLEVRRASGQPPRSAPGDWWLIGRDGRVARRFQCASWAIDDEIGATSYVVEDGALLEITTQEHFRAGREVRETIIIPRLRPVPADDDEAARAIARAIDRERDDQAERRRAAEQAGRDRIAAIAGAEERYDVGDDFERARSALLRRLAAYDSPDVAATLRALAAFGALHRDAPDAWRAPLAWAMEPLVAAALAVALDPSARDPAGGWMDDGASARAWPDDDPRIAALAEVLAATESKLREHAGWADDTDARNTATLLYRAAVGVAASRARLRRIGG